ncbi:MAG: hypothetical protein A2073_08055 [Deltaproteobacteria bacterium GWC2_42_11]|nr:MAG: hypothetical protein A2073_08055 [Deltaproteobacteria bacterium GWC2_42_11]HBO84003.1 hypothetical protein [Deltaproteobacteria bacterium]
MLRLKLYILIAATASYIFIWAAPAFTSSRDSLENRVDMIAQKISRITGVNIKVVIIKDNTPEAYVYPGGLIVLTKGILDIAKTNDELAFIIGHEISHVINDGSSETIFRIIGEHDLPFNIKEEILADISGMNYAEKAGFNPFASVKLLTKMLHNSSQSFDERLEAMSRFLSNKWDPYYWTE